jgi:hypothetical protein
VSRYFTRRAPARATLFVENDHYGKPQEVMPSVDEHVPTFTGLLDRDGDEIWREPRAIGFGRRDEW